MDIRAFKDWLRRNGAEVLAETNQYEIVRFVARGATHVAYHGRRGTTWIGFADEARIAFLAGSSLYMGLRGTQRGQGAKHKHALIARDGKNCFFCNTEMQEDDMTIEHLVSVSKGGPDHQDNMVLAHKKCNQEADNFPLIEKIARARKSWIEKHWGSR